MTKRPVKAKSAPAPQRSGAATQLRNRLIMAVAVMAAAGVLLWKPWAPQATIASAPATRSVAALTPRAPEPPAPPVRPAAILVPAAPEPSPSPTYTIASVPPLPPTPPSPSRMPATLQADFDNWLIDAYRACWTPPASANPDGEPYYPRVRVALKSDGALAGQPKLVNPPADPAWKPHAEAAIKAVKSCDPLKVPEKFAPYYTQWKSKTVFFDPTRS